MTDSIIYFYATYLFVPNLILVLWVIYLIVFGSRNKALYTILLIGLTFLIKLPGFYYNSYSVDETGWIACVRSLRDHFDPYINVDPTTSGIGALIPLYLFSLLFHLDYFSIRIFETMMDLATLHFTYKILLSRLGNNKRLLYVGLILLYSVLNLSFMREFDTYNTEHFCIFIFSVLLFILISLYLKQSESNGQITSRNTHIYIAIAGLLFGFSLFVKLQNLPVMFILFVFYLVFLLSKRPFVQTILFVIYCMVPLLFWFLFFLYNGALHDFYVRYLLTNFEYAENGVKNTKIGLSFRSIIEHSSFVFVEVFSIVFLTFCVLFLANLRRILKGLKSIWPFSFKKFDGQLLSYKLMILFILILAATFFEIVKTKNFFIHYYLLLYQPLILFFVCIARLGVKKWVLASIVMINSLFICGKNYVYAAKDINNIPKYVPFKDMQYQCHFKSIFEANSKYQNEANQLDSVITNTNCDNKYIIVWGPDIHILAYGNFISAYRDIWNGGHWAQHESLLRSYYIHDFLSDIKKNSRGGKLVLIDQPNDGTIASSSSFSAFVNENNLAGNFKSIHLIKSYQGYAFYAIELNNG